MENEELEELTYDQRLARQVEETLRAFLQFPDEHSYLAATLFVLHSHLRAPSGEFLPYITPRLVFLSTEAGCGKTLATELVTRMSYNGKMSLENTSYGLITMLNIDRATIGIDEIDLLLGSGRGQTTTRAVLNAGYKKGGEVIRQRGDEVDSQNVHGPLVLNGKNLRRFMTHANFETLRTRSIPIPLTRKEPGVELQRWRPRVHEERIRLFMRELQAWGTAAARYVIDIDVETVIPPEIDNRDREIWEIFFQLGQFLGGDWPVRVERAARAFVLGERNLEQGQRIDPYDQLSEMVGDLFGDQEDFLSSDTILGRLAELEEKPILWSEWTNTTAQRMGLARGLEANEIKSVRVQRSGEQLRGYTRASFGLPPVVARKRKAQPIPVEGEAA